MVKGANFSAVTIWKRIPHKKDTPWQTDFLVNFSIMYDLTCHLLWWGLDTQMSFWPPNFLKSGCQVDAAQTSRGL